MTLEEIKQQSDILQVATGMLGLKLKQQSPTEWRGKSIFAEGNNETCLKIDTSRGLWVDFKAGKGGSVLDLVAYVKFGNLSAIYEAAKLLSGDKFNSGYWGAWSKQRDKLRKDVDLWHETLLKDEQTLAYLHSRGITDETIRENKLGLIHEWVGSVQEWRLAIPCFNQNREPVSMCSRQLAWDAHDGSPKYKQRASSEFYKKAPFGLETIPFKDEECDRLMIGEGYFDALACKQAGYKILFSGGGYFGKDNEKIVIETARRFREVVLVYDSDKAGADFTEKVGTMLLNAEVSFTCIRNYGEGNKDLSDYYSKGGKIDALTVVSGAAFLASRMIGARPFKALSSNDKDKLVDGAREFLKKIDDDDKDAVMKAFADYFPENRLKKIKKEPSRHEILCGLRDRFLKGREIFYHGTLQHGTFYEYDPKGFWVIPTDADIQHEISLFFNHEESNATVKELTTMIRLKTQREVLPEFNKSPIIPFKNGVYELETGKFRRAEPEDYNTFQLGFEYKPSARNELWERFLAEITCGNRERLRVIRNMLGYLLYPNCDLHKAFFLIGRGRNGKSTLVNVIRKVLENFNRRGNMRTVSSISPTNFDDKTQLICLAHSLVNICDDMKLKVSKDAVEPLKTLICGFELTGNYKFRDTQHFTSRAKIIACCQGTPNIPDTSFGMEERLIFVNFCADFSKKPKRGLDREILKDPAGVFSYILDCYKELKEQGDVIPYEADQRKIMLDYEESANTVVAFLADMREQLVKEIHVTALYNCYLNWAKALNIRSPLTQKKFSRELKEREVPKIHKNDGDYFVFTAAEEATTPAAEEATTPAAEEATTPAAEFNLYQNYLDFKKRYSGMAIKRGLKPVETYEDFLTQNVLVWKDNEETRNLYLAELERIKRAA